MKRRAMRVVPWALATLELGLLCAGEVRAQSAPDAGALRQRLEREQVPAATPMRSPTPTRQGTTVPPEEPEGVVVRGFRFQGNRLLPDERLAAALGGYIGRAYGLKGLREAAAAVARVYREAGWLVRVDLPAQDVSQGQVTLVVVEATFGGVVVEEPLPWHIDTPWLKRQLQGRLVLGAPIRAEEVDRSLLLSRDLAGVSVGGALRAGERGGETVLAASVQDGPRVAGEISLDNTGSRSTGAERVASNLSLASPAQWGDRLHLNLMQARGTRLGQMDYQVPLGGQGGRLNLGLSRMSYRVISPELVSLGSHGASSSLSVSLRYPWIRSQRLSLHGTVGADWRDFLNEANAAIQSRYGVMVLSLGAALDWTDELGEGGQTVASLTWTQGQTHRRAGDPGHNPLLDDRFDKVRWALNRQQRLSEALSVSMSLAGQHSGGTLESSERFSLGGASGVRAYPSGEGQGSSGWLGSVEVRFRPIADGSLAVFADQGGVRNRDDSPSYGLRGWGVTGQWGDRSGWGVRMTCARRLGRNPNPSSTGTDQDGSLVRNRCWAFLSKTL